MQVSGTRCFALELTRLNVAAEGTRAAGRAPEREPTGYVGRTTRSRELHMEVDMDGAVADPAVEDVRGDTRRTKGGDNAGRRLVEHGH